MFSRVKYFYNRLGKFNNEVTDERYALMLGLMMVLVAGLLVIKDTNDYFVLVIGSLMLHGWVYAEVAVLVSIIFSTREWREKERLREFKEKNRRRAIGRTIF